MISLDLNKPLDDENEPFLGQTFLSVEEAFIFYKNYSDRLGFLVRKDRSDTKNGIAIRRDFVCHRAGKQRVKLIDPSKVHRNRESSKCDCKAHMRITLRRSFDIFPEEWHVTSFTKAHNHDLLSPQEMHFMPANRIITHEDEKQIFLYKKAGLSVRQIIRVLELQKGIKHGDLPFIDKDIRNLFAKVKKMCGTNDAMSLMEYMRSEKEKNMLFQYEYTVDEERRLEHLFWCHPQSFEWYDKYGDVVVFDTTYKVNAYDMPCAFFVGMDNHGKTVLFGCALLRNETTSTFKWLMKTFVTVMTKPPKTIITDQDACITEAIATEMPLTKHCFCIWHITSKFSCWFNALLRNDYQKWCADFYTLYKMSSPDEFEQNWPLVLEKYNLYDNKHVRGLYEIRSFWAPAYLRQYFFGGMITTGRSESINAFIKRFVSSHTNLRDFVSQVDIAIEEIVQGRSYNKMSAKLRPTSLKTKSPLEQQALKVLTPYAFKKFQEELMRTSQYSLAQVNGEEFIINHFEGANHHERRVFWNGKMTLCSCKNFEFWGILCRHVLRVLFHTNCFEIPSLYFPTRWHCDAQDATETQEAPREEILVAEEPTIMSNTSAEGEQVFCPPKSITKGRPRKRRIKGGKELGKKQTKCCSLCKQPGHTKPTCQNKDNTILNGGSTNMVQQRKENSASDPGRNPVLSLKY